jgi:PAS domain S-box-containing protein
MKSRLITLLQRMHGWRLSTLVALGAIVAAVIIVSAMDLLLKGEVTWDYLLTGLVTAGIVAPPSLALLGHLLRELTLQQRDALSNAVERVQAHFRLALETTDEGILMVDHNGNVVSRNQRFLELWRIPPEIASQVGHQAMLQHALDQLVDPEAFLAEVRRLYAGIDEADDLLHFKDGRVYARHTRAWSSGGERGRIWRFKDITEQARIQEALAEREEIYRTIVTQSSEAIALLEVRSLSFVEFNQAANEGLGYSHDEFARFGLHEIQAEMDQVTLRGRLPAVIGGQVRNFETLFRHKDGSTRNILVSLRAIELRETPFLVATWSDISERKQSELALLESRNLLRAVIDTAPVRVFWKDQDLRYLGCNPAFARDAGRSRPEEMIGQDDYAMAWSDQATLYRADDRAIMKSGIAKLNYEEPQTTPEGQRIWLNTSKTPLLDAEGKVIGILGIYQDITEKKRIQDQLKLAVEVTQVVVWELNFETGRLSYDRAMISILGMPKDAKFDDLHALIGQIGRAHV